MKSTTSYVVTDNIGALLCRDNLFRDFAFFGTYSNSVKGYKTVGHALNAARNRRIRFNASANLVVMTIQHNEDLYMNSFHLIWNGVKKTFPQLIADAKNGVNNGFPVTFTFPQ